MRLRHSTRATYWRYTMRTITLLFYVAPALFLTLGCASDTGTTDPITRANGVEPSPESARFTEWSTPVNLDPPPLRTLGLNSPAIDQHPVLSKDGLSLY